MTTESHSLQVVLNGIFSTSRFLLRSRYCSGPACSQPGSGPARCCCSQPAGIGLQPTVPPTDLLPEHTAAKV